MKISLNWLNEFVNLGGIDIRDIVSRFSLTTAEIEGYEIKKPKLDAVVVEILTCEKVATSNKLSKLTITDGKKKYQVACAAPNVRVGLKTAWANVGTKVLAGIESTGMCLGADELGMSNLHESIIELDSSAKVGAPIAEALPFICDTIIEIDNKSITNRPDLWGHYGIARELACIFDRELKPLKKTSLTDIALLPEVPVKIESDLCQSFGAVKVKNITRKVTPLEMQARLFYLDINPHGFLVDLSNYIMLEVGQPNHAYDGASSVRLSASKGLRDGEVFTTLKGQVIKADMAEEMLFIKNNGSAVALAGIMGGQESGINADTIDAVFEFATFDSGSTRKTAAGLGIRTDASARFEKSLDTNLNLLAAERMVYLLNKYDKKASPASKWSYKTTRETKPIALRVDTAYVEKFCGVKFIWKDIIKKLTALGFEPTMVFPSADALDVVVPTWRATKDVTMQADIIEEIVRTYGYDKIVPMPPRVDVEPIAQPVKKVLVNRLKDALANVHGLQEVHTYIWSDTPSKLKVINSCIKGCDYVREALGPSLLSIIAKNGQARIFEIGQVVSNGKDEHRHLGICVPSYAELASILRALFGAKFKIGEFAGVAGFHPKNNATVLVDGKAVGCIGVAVDKDVAIAEINIDGLDPTRVNGGGKTFAAPSKYQKNHLDFTFEYDGVYGDIESAFDKFKHPLNMGFRLKDVYNKSYTLEFTVGSYEKTLTAEDINDIWSKIIEFGRKNGLTLKQ
ncbi:MAG: phenylalanine--tRNA ligase subunit beta [Christensenellaceae bacterium]|jgi:phenylalanyl-tRNA synthetase beta chain|nr:phenylalanine--tRNA ligase subunit beta [Christensenellaceae bacterium]